MQEGGAVLVDLHAAVQQVVVIGAPGVEHHGMIRMPGQEQAHVHTAKGSRLQGHAHGLVRDEVRRGEEDPLLGHGNGGEEDALDRLGGCVRSGGDDLHHVLAHRLLLRVPTLADHVAAGGEEPVLGEHLLEVLHRRPADGQVCVPPGGDLLAAAGRVIVGDVHAAREGQAAVDDSDLAVVAQVQVPVTAEAAHRQELGVLPAGRPQGPHEAVQAVGAHPVGEQPHHHALLGLLHQQVAEALAGAVILEDVVQHVHMVGGPLDGGLQLTVGLLGLDQQLHLVAAGGRAAPHAVAQQHKLPLRRLGQLGGRLGYLQVGQLLLLLIQVRVKLGVAGVAAADLAVQAAATNQKVEQDPHVGQEHDEEDPGQGGGGLAALEHDTQDGEDGQQVATQHLDRDQPSGLQVHGFPSRPSPRGAWCCFAPALPFSVLELCHQVLAQLLPDAKHA